MVTDNLDTEVIKVPGYFKIFEFGKNILQQHGHDVWTHIHVKCKGRGMGLYVQYYNQIKWPASYTVIQHED